MTRKRLAPQIQARLDSITLTVTLISMAAFSPFSTRLKPVTSTPPGTGFDKMLFLCYTTFSSAAPPHQQNYRLLVNFWALLGPVSLWHKLTGITGIHKDHKHASMQAFKYIILYIILYCKSNPFRLTVVLSQRPSMALDTLSPRTHSPQASQPNKSYLESVMLTIQYSPGPSSTSMNPRRTDGGSPAPAGKSGCTPFT